MERFEVSPRPDAVLAAKEVFSQLDRSHNGTMPTVAAVGNAFNTLLEHEFNTHPSFPLWQKYFRASLAVPWSVKPGFYQCVESDITHNRNTEEIFQALMAVSTRTLFNMNSVHQLMSQYPEEMDDVVQSVGVFVQSQINNGGWNSDWSSSLAKAIEKIVADQRKQLDQINGNVEPGTYRSIGDQIEFIDSQITLNQVMDDTYKGEKKDAAKLILGLRYGISSWGGSNGALTLDEVRKGYYPHITIQGIRQKEKTAIVDMHANYRSSLGEPTILARGSFVRVEAGTHDEPKKKKLRKQVKETTPKCSSEEQAYMDELESIVDKLKPGNAFYTVSPSERAHLVGLARAANVEVNIEERYRCYIHFFHYAFNVDRRFTLLVDSVNNVNFMRIEFNEGDRATLIERGYTYDNSGSIRQIMEEQRVIEKNGEVVVSPKEIFIYNWNANGSYTVSKK